MSDHDAKVLGARQRRQRQLAERKGSGDGRELGSNFDRVQNFGSSGVVGFLVQSGAAGSGSSGARGATPTPGGAEPPASSGS